MVVGVHSVVDAACSRAKNDEENYRLVLDHYGLPGADAGYHTRDDYSNEIATYDGVEYYDIRIVSVGIVEEQGGQVEVDDAG